MRCYKINKFIALKTVIEQQNITKAAKILGYTQPGVTQVIQNLEKEFGFDLLIKRHNQIKLTPKGQKLYPLINRIINDYQSLDDTISEINNETSVIKIATIPSISQQLLPRLIANFQVDNPKTEFSIVQGDNTSIPNWVDNGDADIGFVNLSDTNNSFGTVIQDQIIKAILPLELADKYKSPIPLKQLAKLPYVLLEEGLVSESLSVYNEINIQPHIKMRLHDSFSTLLMVEQGIGYSIMPMENEFEKQHRIKSFDTVPSIKRQISLVNRDESIMTSSANRFIKYIKKNPNCLWYKRR
ncbi:LysR substrate-binding domain-containing protein [Lactobacillaceae bacterium Melli_B3]